MQTRLSTPILTSAASKESQWGTFKDSLRSPVHSWFTYPAGFSYKAVENTIDLHHLIPGKSVIYDPFMGSGTTNIVAKMKAINSIGIEAHPFVFDIAQAKMTWSVNSKLIKDFLESLDNLTSKVPSKEEVEISNKIKFPELLLKCFLPESLYSLGIIRDMVTNHKYLDSTEKRFLHTSLICSLRDVSIAATGWPYIAPNKIKITSMSKNAITVFKNKCIKMIDDLEFVKLNSNKIKSEHDIVLGDSRHTVIPSESVDHIFTSPPYLNNFDYTDRTRLEMYFMGAAKTWGELSQRVRTKLMTSATTQIHRSDRKYILNKEIDNKVPEVYKFIRSSQLKLERIRKTKGGKKSYDLLITGYFNDIFDILKDNFRVLKKGKTATYILGDSAPYGVHIPTDEIIGKLGIGIGFKNYNIEILRTRGGKWPSNPQRHNVKLRETVLTLKK
ncbi:hypothetical protein KBD45_06460 [Candidatus Dojkabacteria bacterium]|nr:hypothetical protein [Candidatus Dojkabacteria bacterium]